MTSRGYALARAELIRVLTAYSGITTSDGAAGGGTLVDTNLIDNAFISPSGIPEKSILILNGNARGEDKGAASFDNGTGTITFQGTGFSATILAGTIYRILNISSIEIDVARIEAKVDIIDGVVDSIIADIATQKGATGIFYEQPDAAFNVSVDNSENDIFDLSTASTRYIVINLRLKSVDPGAGETITIRLYELINDSPTLVDSFVIDHDNYMTYFSLMDMFGVPQLAGDDIHLVAIGSVAGPIAVTGQYSHAKTNN